MRDHLKARTSVRPVVCIVHQSDAHLGRFKPWLERFGREIVEVEAASSDLAQLELGEIGGLVSLGGEMGAGDAGRFPFLAMEIELLGAAHEQGVPILGICLGGQLLASALGAPVNARRCGEIGWLEVEHFADDPVLGPAGTRRQFQWHSDSFEAPVGAELLAGSAACPAQAFRAGASYGVQFHPEVSHELLTTWVSAEGASAELVANGVDPEALLREAAELDVVYERQAETMMSGFERLVAARA